MFNRDMAADSRWNWWKDEKIIVIVINKLIFFCQIPKKSDKEVLVCVFSGIYAKNILSQTYQSRVGITFSNLTYYRSHVVNLKKKLVWQDFSNLFLPRFLPISFGNKWKFDFVIEVDDSWISQYYKIVVITCMLWKPKFGET